MLAGEGGGLKGHAVEGKAIEVRAVARRSRGIGSDPFFGNRASVTFTPMADQFVDPERFKRFQQFLDRHMSVFVDASSRAFAKKGPGVLIYRAPDDRFEGEIRTLSLEYKTKAEIEAAQKDQRDELIQGMLERYMPPAEALLVAIYPDKSYDISRVVIRPGGPKPN
jgi:hypothetical protein